MTSGYLLDTNVVSELSKPAPEGKVLLWLKTVEVPHLSVITLGELAVGFHLLPQGRRRTDLEDRTTAYLVQPKIKILPVTEQIATRWGKMVAARQQAGRPLSAPDGLIAATALEHGLTLATRNTRDFAGLNLSVFDPWLDEANTP